MIFTVAMYQSSTTKPMNGIWGLKTALIQEFTMYYSNQTIANFYHNQAVIYIAKTSF